MMVTPLARAMPYVVGWQPVSWLMGAGTAFVLVGGRSDAAGRAPIASAGVAAATAFLFDDSAADTLAASPTPLSVRRLHRFGIAASALTLWWVTLAAIASVRGFRPGVEALEIAALATVALAVSAVVAQKGDRIGGGIAGAACSAACFGSTFLPPRWWLPFPADASAPGAATRLIAIEVCAVALLAFASRDPAR